MGSIYVTSPRMVNADIKLHPAEVANVACQRYMLEGYTEEELQKIADAVHMELNRRQNKTG